MMVGIAEFAVVRDQAVILATSPLGAGMGIAIHDPVARVSGLLHSMLPDSSIDTQRAAVRPGMFLDTGLAALLEAAAQQHATEANLRVYAAGGGRIMDDGALFNLGGRNHEVLLELLAKRGLKLQAGSIGGLVNRTMQLDAATGAVQVRVSGRSEATHLCKP